MEQEREITLHLTCSLKSMNNILEVLEKAEKEELITGPYDVRFSDPRAIDGTSPDVGRMMRSFIEFWRVEQQDKEDG